MEHVIHRTNLQKYFPLYKLLEYKYNLSTLDTINLPKLSPTLHN